MTSDDEQHNQIPASLPIDPAPRQQLETQTEIEVNDNAFNSDSTPADYQAAQTINQKIPKHCLTTMLGDTSGTTRERLWRLALIMNHLDRTQTRSRADLINSLWEGESNQVSLRTLADTADISAIRGRLDSGIALHLSIRLGRICRQ